MRFRLPVAASILASLSLVTAACADDAPPPESGRVTLGADEGVDFGTGKLRSPGNYANSDLFASANGDNGLKLSTGGDAPTSNRPITWFRNAGQIPQIFASLAEVPAATPTTIDFVPSSKPGQGFVLETADGDFVRGWLETATSTEVTIQWERE